MQGNAPWAIHYTFNGVPQQIVTYQASTSVYFPNGLYQFINVVDSTGCTASINQSFNFQYQPLSWTINQQGYDCDSNLYKIQWAFTGNAPWTLTYELIGGFVYNQVYTTPNATLYLPNGQWQILSISDNTGCFQNINLPVSNNFVPLNVSVVQPQYNCDSNKMEIGYTLQGNAPFVFQVNQLNNNTTQWLSTTQSNASFWWNMGQYMVQQVTDATGCIQTLNQYINHTIQPLSYQSLPKQFNCDSQKVEFPFIWQGNSPWILSYRNLNNGLVYTQLYANANASLWLSSGQYVLLSLSDAYCTIPLNDTLHVQFPSINAQVNTPGILCDSAKATLLVNVQSGLSPMYLHYVYNGVPDSLIINTGAQTHVLPNGNYYFTQIRDSVNCSFPINSTYNAQYIPLKWLAWQNKYNCIEDTNNIVFNINGANNTTMYYTRNGMPNTLVMNQGANLVQWGRAQYKLAYLIDTAQCVLPIDTTFVINDVPVDLKISELKPICIDKVHEYTFNVKGKSPWTIAYNVNNTTQKIALNDSINRWTCAPGMYNFVQITDNNDCVLPINRIDTLEEFIPYNPILTTNYQTLHIEPNNFETTWWFNQALMDTLQYVGPTIRHTGEGNYQASIVDNANCTWLSNIVTLAFENQITVYPNPSYNQIAILIQDNYGDKWKWHISNAIGQEIAMGEVTAPLEILDIRNWPAGIYTIKIEYQNSPTIRIARFIKK